MAMIEPVTLARSGAVNTVVTLIEAAGRGLAALPGAVIGWFAAWSEARRTARELTALSPALLDDVGLTEADVRRYERAARLF